jgi:hypothetical protein
MLWEGKTPRPGSRALGHGYKGGDDMRDIHCVDFSTKAGRKHGEYFIVSEPGEAEFFVVSFDVNAPPGTFKKEYGKIKEEALWLLCAKPEHYQSTYVCRSRVSAELLYDVIKDVFGGSLRRIALCPVKPSTSEYKARVEELLDNTRNVLLGMVEESATRCHRWTGKARSRFKERVERLRAVDASLADTVELVMGECFEYTSHGGSTRGPSMVRGGGLW